MVWVSVSEKELGVMAMTTVGLRDSNKSLPADIRTAFAPQTYLGNGMGRLNHNADVVQNSRHWGGRGVNGLGDCNPSEDNNWDLADCTFTSTDPQTSDPVYATTSWYDPGNIYQTATVPAGAKVVPPANTGGVDAAAIAKIIAAGASSLVPIIAATSQGVLYKVDPKTGAMTVYSQPAGSNVNLPIGGSIGTFNTPLGTGMVAGFDSSTLIMIALVGAVALFAFKK